MSVIGMCTSRTLLGFLGLIFFVSGIASIAIGSMIINRYYSSLKTIEHFNLMQVPAVLFIFVGILFFLAGISGCCNLFRDSKGCLASFFVFLFVLVSLMIAAASLGTVYRDEINNSLRNSLNASLRDYNKTNITRGQVDDLQQLFKCCGIDSSADWGDKVPDSCFNGRNRTEEIFGYGCFERVKTFFDHNFGYIIGASVALLVILVLGMIGSCVLFCYKKNDTYFTLN